MSHYMLQCSGLLRGFMQSQMTGTCVFHLHAPWRSLKALYVLSGMQQPAVFAVKHFYSRLNIVHTFTKLPKRCVRLLYTGVSKHGIAGVKCWGFRRLGSSTSIMVPPSIISYLMWIQLCLVEPHRRTTGTPMSVKRSGSSLSFCPCWEEQTYLLI